MPDDVSSLNIDLLSAHLESGRRLATESETERAQLSTFEADVIAGCPSNHWDGKGVSLAEDLIALWTENNGAATVIRDEVAVDASGQVTIANEVIERALFDQGYSQPPDEIAVELGEAVGLLPMSGFADDPVCTFNGNFIYEEIDLSTAGFAQLIEVRRIYNSLMCGRTGIFGRGWTTTLDMAVTVTVDGAVATIADGAEVPFTFAEDMGQTDDGEPLPKSYLPNRRRGLSLEATNGGWTLHEGLNRRWHFDRDGLLLGGEERGGSFAVRRTDRMLTVVENTSGRSMRYDLNANGLVEKATASDGRSVDYRYQAEHCVAVVRAVGDVSYLIEADRIASVVDADGVVICANTYDSEGRIATQRSPHGTEATYVYDDNHATRLTYSHDGAANLYFHDQRGRLVAMFGADGRAMRTTFDEHDRVIRIVERSGASFNYAYEDDHYLVPEPEVAAGPTSSDAVHQLPSLHDQWTRRTDGLGAVEERFFDRHGRLLRHIDVNGGIHDYRYELHHQQPIAVGNPMGGETRIELDHHGLVVGMVDSDGYGHRFERNQDGLVKIVVDSAGQFLTYTYDDAAQLVSVSEASGQTRARRFDEGGRVVTEDVEGEQTQSYRYSPAGRMVACDASNGGSWVARYGAHGDLVAFMDSVGGTVGFDYDDVGNPIAMTLPDGGRFVTEFDALGQVTASTDPAGNRFEQLVDPAGRHRTVIDAQGAVWNATFDVAGRLIAQSDPLGGETKFAYHPGGQLAAFTPATTATSTDGGTVRYEINAAGWTSAIVDADGGRTTIEYSPAGRPLARVSPAGRSVTFRYDDGGSLCAIVDEDGLETTPTGAPSTGSPGTFAANTFSAHGVGAAAEVELYGLEPLDSGQVSAMGVPAQLDPKLNRLLGDRPPTFGDVLASMHQLLNGGRADLERTAAVWSGSIDAVPNAGGETAFEVRDQRGLVGRVTDPAGAVTDFVNDVMGRPVAISAGDGATTLIGYGPIGGVSALTNPLGETTTAERTLSGRVQRLRFADGSGLDYTYDLLGRVSTVADPSDRPAPGESGEPGISSYRYGPSGQLAAATTPDGTVAATHGSNGELRSTTGLDRSTVTYEYDPDGLLLRRTRQSLATVATTTYRRSRGGRVTAIIDSEVGEIDLPNTVAPVDTTSISASTPATPGRERRDDANRIVADRHGRTHRYDEAGRLIESLNADGDRWTFTYDAVGLLSREQHPHRGSRHYAYNAARQLVAIETETGLDATFSYDAAGRRVAAECSNGERVRYHWRGLHQLVAIERVDRQGQISTRRIAYSGFGRPELIDAGTADEVSIGWDDGMTGKPVEIGDRRYLRSGLDVRPAVPDAGRGAWSDGTVDDPWGDTHGPTDGDRWVADDTIGVGLGYRNELTVDGLVIMGDRVYEPASRSFLTVDPLPAVPGANAFAGVYAYAGNDPVNLVDPSGRRPLTIDEFAEKRAELERSRFGNFVHPVTKWAPTAGLVIRVAPELLNTVAVLGLSYVVGSQAERYGLGGPWNHVYGNYVVPLTVQRLYAAAAGESDPANRGDLGGTFGTEIRQPFLAAGETEEERGLNALIRGLDDTGNPDQIQTDEFEIIDHGNGSYTLVLPGVTDLSSPVLGFDPYDQSVRDNDQGAVYSLQSADIDDNIYAAYVAEYLDNNSDVPPGADLMIIGHSYGADTAMDLAADDDFATRYNVTHVVAAAYNSGPQTPFVDADTQVLVLENANDKAVLGEAIGHGPFVEPDVDPTQFENIVYRHFDGGNVGIGHHQDNYIEYMLDADDPEMTAFFESIDLAGFTRPGKADAVDISLQD